MTGMSNFRIKEPGKGNIKKTAGVYNSAKGRGIEVFYNIKRGKLVIAEYYKNFNQTGYRKLPTVNDDVHLPSITPEYLMEEIKKIKQNEIDARVADKKKEKEALARFKAQRKDHYKRMFKLSK
jgi:hypothetical protein